MRWPMPRRHPSACVAANQRYLFGRPGGKTELATGYWPWLGLRRREHACAVMSNGERHPRRLVGAVRCSGFRERVGFWEGKRWHSVLLLTRSWERHPDVNILSSKCYSTTVPSTSKAGG